MTTSASGFLRQIQGRYPEIAIRTVRLDTSGQSSDILIVNEESVFRFPRYPDAIARLTDEAAILRAIRPHLPLPVPNPTYQSLGTDIPGAAFIGYPLLPGEPLRRALFDTLDQAVQERVRAQLAGFLRALHGIPPATISREMAIADGQAYWSDLYARIQAQLFPVMRRDARAELALHFETFLGEPANFTWSPVLRHGDFGPSNILFDPATARVVGVIDFGSAARGDPAVDLAALSTYGQKFFAAFQRGYPITAAMLKRATFYRGTFALQEALFGIAHGDAAAFARGMAGYR